MSLAHLAERRSIPLKIYRNGEIYASLYNIDSAGRPWYRTPHNHEAALTSRAARLWPSGGAGLNLDGTGVIVGLWDAGRVRASHNSFQGRATFFSDANMTDHATHVAGTIMGGGPTSGLKGGAYEASLRSYDWNNDLAEARTAAEDGLVLSAHPYGPLAGWDYGDHGALLGLAVGWYWFGSNSISVNEDYAFGFYTDEVRDWDQLAFDRPNYTSVWAVGDDRGQGPTTQPTGYYWNGLTWLPNLVLGGIHAKDGGTTGYDTIAGPALGKNVITVGTVDDVINYVDKNSVVTAPFSAAGPTDDGRIKPDIVANGVSVTSSIASSDAATGTMSGSSMASASATAAMALLVQHYRNTHDGADMRSATMKALLINSADEAGPNPGPDYVNGWGLLNAEKAAQAISRDAVDSFQIQENTLNNGTGYTYKLYSDGTQPIKLTIAWTDRPGNPVSPQLDPTNVMLVNDLDVRISKGGTTYMPWVLNRTAPHGAATTGDNFLDNVEQIWIPAPEAGIYTVVVSHNGTLVGGSQDFSMVGSGYYTQPSMTSVDINGTYIASGNSTNAIVRLNAPAPPGGFTFAPRPVAGITMRSSVTIPEGQTSSAAFPVIANYDPSLTGTRFYSVWMDAYGQSVGKVLTVVPLKLRTIGFDKDTVQQGETLRLMIQLTGPAPTGGYTVNVRRSPSYWIETAETVTIPKGQSTVYVDVKVKSGAPPTSVASIIVSHPLGEGTVTLGKLFTIVN